MKKMNNKGFSLVELIVVVLIMAIIAVALAPQVMKWVENSRKSNDIENYNALVEAANVAGTSETFLSALKTTTGRSCRITMNDNATTTTLSALETQIVKTLPDWASTGIQGTWTSVSTPFTIDVVLTADGVNVIQQNKPVKDFE